MQVTRQAPKTTKIWPASAAMKIKLETGSNARELTKAAAKPSKTGGTTRNASLTKCSQPQRQKSGAAVPVVVVVVVTAAITVLPSRAFPQSRIRLRLPSFLYRCLCMEQSKKTWSLGHLTHGITFPLNSNIRAVCWICKGSTNANAELLPSS